MCGIAGILNFGNEKVSPELLSRMIGMIRYRGPDGLGTHLEDQIGLAHARLSIIDLEGGSQPMSNKEGTLWITFNGEIYNYPELREELEKKGYSFATKSDTEVILRMYEDKGEECVKYFNGQWAFAIWDSRKKRLFLSRDRFGVRPLFYTRTGRSFVFGSEIKTIFVHPESAREIDAIGLDQIFTFWCNIPPTTPFKDILELPPAHSMTISEGKMTIKPYWEMDYLSGGEPPAEGVKSEEDYAEQLFQLLSESVKIRLRSDVPVGAYLSGGLDSSIIAALAARHSSKPLETFSVTFEDPEFDEQKFQIETVKYLNTRHQEIRCTTQDIRDHFPEVIWHTEKPVIRTAPAPLFLLSRLVKEKGYKVVLTGEGADEILGGYDIFKESKIRRFWGTFPESKRRPLLLRRLYPYLPDIQSQPEAYLKAFFHVKKEDYSNPFFSHLPRWEMTSGIKIFYSDVIKQAVKGSNPYNGLLPSLSNNYSKWDSFSQSQYLEAKYLLPGYILSSQGDRMSMAHSVEGRFPFLDPRLAEFAARIPSRLKMKVLNEKYILKKAVGELIPQSVKKRFKQPYRAPEAKSFLNGGGTSRESYVGELLSPDRVRKDGIFNPLAVEKLVEKGSKNQVRSVKDNMAFVGILSTQLLIDQFINHFDRQTHHAIH